MPAPPPSTAELEKVADTLAGTAVSGLVFNQYSYLVSGPMQQANAQRRQNLLLYWQNMVAYRPKVLLVGEAPGYRGCRLTGIPFTSPAILGQICGSHPLFGREHGFAIPDEVSGLGQEASATIVWQAISELKRPPLLWNAFPFHPFLTGKTRSNRRPGKQELLIGLPFLLQIIDLFAVETVIAVGNTAADMLSKAEITAGKIRHPAHGGKQAFIDGLLSYVNGTTREPK